MDYDLGIYRPNRTVYQLGYTLLVIVSQFATQFSYRIQCADVLHYFPNNSQIFLKS